MGGLYAEDDMVVPLLYVMVSCMRSILKGPRLRLLLPVLPLRLLVKKLCMLSWAFAAIPSSPVSCSANRTPTRAKSRALTLLDTGCVGVALGCATLIGLDSGAPGPPIA